MNHFLLALDQGTTSSRAVLFNEKAELISIAQQEFTQHFPQPGWVEHDPMEIWESQRAVMQQVVAQSGIDPRQIAAIGITNQRETTLVWDRETGKPIYPAIVWQDRRTATICEGLVKDGLEPHIKQATGLVADAYFSGTKVRWILDHVPGAQAAAEGGKLCFGTVDSWLLWQLTNGEVHATDVSNASRTMLFNLHTLDWDEKMLHALRIPKAMLPQVKSSADDFGMTSPDWFGGYRIPIRGVAGDQQSALFGQACYEPGTVKNTYGTGCFLLMNTENKPVHSNHGLLTTVAWRLGNETTYALEGSVFIAGAALQWLRDGLGLIESASESEALATSVKDNGGVYFVPAFAGLGAPWWDMYARGLITGITRGSTKAHLVRAALESICYQTRDVIDAMQKDSGIHLSSLRVDGGAVVNEFLMQFQADVLNASVLRPTVNETTALGAALLAGIGVGLWKPNEINQVWKANRIFSPSMSGEVRLALYEGWLKAVKKCEEKP
jgi:glycerol kinase